MTSLVSLDDLDAEPHAVLFPDEEPKTIRLSLAAGDVIAAHRHPGREIVAHVLDGRIAFSLGDETHEVGPGDVARFDGDQEISPRAIEDSRALLVLAPAAD